MSRLKSPPLSPFNEMGFAALAITNDGSHIGILYRLIEGGPISMMHLCWDHQLLNRQFGARHHADYVWVELAIDPLRAKQIGQFCVEVSQSNPDGIPYAFGDPMGAFADDGKWIEANQRVGLTCASFVLSILEQVGINLVDRRAWRKHWDDALFFSWMIRALRGEFSPDPPAALRPDHWMAVEDQVARGAVRYKPMEVAGAATAGYMPISFFEAFMLAGDMKCDLPDGHAIPRHLL
jgi:hypothetical protein